MIVAPKDDHGGMLRARTNRNLETGEPEPLIVEEVVRPGVKRWQCRCSDACTFVWKTCASEKVCDGFKSHVIRKHDYAPEFYKDDGTDASSFANYLFPLGTNKHRAEMAKAAADRMAKRAAAEAAAAETALLPLAAAPPSAEPTLEAAYDMLVAVGFSATDEQLATLASAVKVRIGMTKKEPKAKKRLLHELGDLGGAAPSHAKRHGAAREARL